jgi:hypothetical protein
MPKTLKRSKGMSNLFNPNSHNQFSHTRKSVVFSNGRGTTHNNNLSRVPNSRESMTSLRKPGAYLVPPTRVMNMNRNVNRTPIQVNESSRFEGGSRRKTRKLRKSRARKMKKAL